MDAFEEARQHLVRWRSEQSNTLLHRQRKWRGQVFDELIPQVGSVYRGGATPLVDGSEWVKLREPDGEYVVRIK